MKTQKNQSQINVKKELYKYLSFWKLFVISILICFTATFFYIKYKSPVYFSQSKIKILNDGNNINLPPDFNSLFNNTSYIKLINEIANLKSKRIINSVVKDLNLTTKYYTKGKIRNVELWNVPIKVTIVENQDSIFPATSFNIKILNYGYKISNDTTSFIVKGENVKIKLGNQEFLIDKNPNFFKKNDKKEFFVKVTNSTYVTENLIKNLVIEPYDKQSDILCISLQDVNIEKTNATINKIVEKLNEDGIKDRQSVSKRTIEFIDDRFNYLIDELNNIENKKKEYKQKNKLSFIEEDAVIDVQKKFQTKDQVLAIETQIELLNLLKDALFNNDKFELLPSNIGIDNSNLNELVKQYNDLIYQRGNLLKTGGKQNPAILNTESQILISKNNINKSIFTFLKQLKLNLSIQKTNYNNSADLVNKLPNNEKILRGIERQQQVKENLYLLLLQKREESAIAYAITTPSIKVLDYANASIIPVEPKKDILYLSSLLIGIFIPYVLISLYFFFNTKIKSINEQEFINSEIPIIGEIPFFDSSKIFSDKNDRSVHSEIFRILTSNCKFLLPLKEENQGQVILVTSSIMGEGKTFITSNLALAFASYDSKVLLIGADMRKPKLKEALKMDYKGFGLSSYLSDNNIDWKDLLVINDEYNSNLNILFGGLIPPNPSNLFSNNRFEKLINEAKKEFDYIIIDCPPTIYVNDTFLISNFADLTVYMTRFNVTDKELINYSKNLQFNNKLKNMAYVLNGIKTSSSFNYNYNYQYNYGYGYGYGNEVEKKSYKKIINRIITTIIKKFKKS